MSEWIDVTQADNLPPGQCKLVDVDDVTVAVYNIDGNFYAIEDTCTHDGGELATGVVEGNEVICPRHGARFCIKTGEALTAPAYEDVDCYPVRLRDGVIQVRETPEDD